MNVTLAVCSDEYARGSFELAQDKSWGCWEGMSSCSGPWSGSDVRWKSSDRNHWQAFYNGNQCCCDLLSITVTQFFNLVDNPADLIVRNAKVFSMGNQICRRWWFQGNHMCAIGRISHYVETYSRKTTRRLQRITTTTSEPYAEQDQQTEPDDVDQRTEPEDGPQQTELGW